MARRRYEPQKELAAAVRQLREGAGLKQSELAARTGMSPSWLSKIESGDYDPSWGSVRLVAQGLGISTRTLAERFEAELARGASERP